MMMTPDFNHHDLRDATTPKALERGLELVAHVKDLDWDEYSLWGHLPSEGISLGYLAVHYAGGPLSGECSCPDGHAVGLCAHMVAVALAFLDDNPELILRS
jgi:uncharacterized Zn finger protein